jgi:Ras-related protein Rab-6A
MNILFMETSAKAGHNVKSLFKKIAMSLPGMDKEGQSADAQNQSQSKPFTHFPASSPHCRQRST